MTSLRSYFGLGSEAAYTGARFEHLGGGGDRVGVADVVTAEDLVAVQMLSVTVPAQVSLDLLEGPPGRALSELLSRIPADADMVEVDAAQLDTGSAADQAWRLLRRADGVGWVKAGKLLARKRPRLIPVYDNVVKCLLGWPPHFWLPLHTALRADDHALHHTLLDLRKRAGVPETVSALRVCDIVLWMAHAKDHKAGRCAARGTLSV
ncbi:DUF6308 family protein [Streptomyces sp. BK022]|uniref:DUF6308 family protein n=1 Tax=Streptomyces sp. BK022 TaxID=2512123 RepID=UPI001F5F7DC0|nr:DUF6308 family protein [Streptomyces sp. BK022]